MLKWVELNKIPTRIAFNAIKPVNEVQKDIETIRELIKEHESEFGILKFAFLSDFNFKGERRNNHCYMHMVKPCVFTDGNGRKFGSKVFVFIGYCRCHLARQG